MSALDAFNDLIDAKTTFIKGVRESALREQIAYVLRGDPKNEQWGSQSRGLLVRFLADHEPADHTREIAIELLHNAALAIDDLLDKADYRRGNPAFWVRYGSETTILVVHIIISIVMQQLTKFPRSVPSPIISSIFSDISEMAMAELRAERLEINSGLDYIAYAQAKTGRLFERAAALGLSNMHRKSRSIIRAIGRIGLLHQLVDDERDSVLDGLCTSNFGQCNWTRLPPSEIKIIMNERYLIREVMWPHLKSSFLSFKNSEKIVDLLERVGGLTDAMDGSSQGERMHA